MCATARDLASAASPFAPISSRRAQHATEASLPSCPPVAGRLYFGRRGSHLGHQALGVALDALPGGAGVGNGLPVELVAGVDGRGQQQQVGLLALGRGGRRRVLACGGAGGARGAGPEEAGRSAWCARFSSNREEGAGGGGEGAGGMWSGKAERKDGWACSSAGQQGQAPPSTAAVAAGGPDCPALPGGSSAAGGWAVGLAPTPAASARMASETTAAVDSACGLTATSAGPCWAAAPGPAPASASNAVTCGTPPGCCSSSPCACPSPPTSSSGTGGWRCRCRKKRQRRHACSRLPPHPSRLSLPL